MRRLVEPRVGDGKMSRGCKFNERWLDNDEYKTWLERGPNPRVASCKICKKDLQISAMGKSALASHVKGKKHQELMRRLVNPGPASWDFIQQTSNELSGATTFTTTSSPVEATRRVKEEPSAGSFNPHQSAGNTTTDDVESFVTFNPTLRAEICWATKVVTSHYSYKSCENAGDIFRTMFPDSDIAKQFTCGPNKVAYLTTFGIAPHFSSLMKTKAKEETGYVLLFYESLNREVKKHQLDLHVRFWNDNHIKTRYLTSFFMGLYTVEQMYEKIKVECSDIGFQNLIQMSTDGPNVNSKLFYMIQQNIEEQTGKKLLNVGSCGLHVLHNSFRAGCTSTNWELGNALSSLVWLFKDIPARKEEYTLLTGSSSFPLDFCNQRWLENVEVAERALQILPFLKTYINAAKTKTVTEPYTKSFETAQMVAEDDLLPAKLHFFLTVAREISPFLKFYQTDKPMLPFMSENLTSLLRSIMEKFIKPSIMRDATTMLKLLQVDYSDPVNHVDVVNLKIGFGTEQALDEHTKKDPDAESLRLEFRQNCRQFLLKVLSKLFEDAPLKYPLVRSLSVLDPRVLLKSEEESTRRLVTILQLLVEAGCIEEKRCDEILREFGYFYDHVLIAAADDFRNFHPENGRLDEFYHQHLSDREEFCLLWEVVKLVLNLSHGQTSIERRFSVNEEAMVENLKEHSLIAQRVIHDHVQSVGGLLKVAYTKELLLSAAAARRKYHQYLDAQRRQKRDEQKRKGLKEEIQEIKAKQERMEEDIKVILKSTDHNAEKAESHDKLSFISKSNGLQRTAQGKQRSLETLEKLLTDKLEKMKDTS